MKSQAVTAAPLWRQRLPFLGLLALAVTGILAAEGLPAPSALWLAAAAASLLAFAATRHGAAVAALVICVFAAVHLWQGRESPAAEYARQVGTMPRLATVRGIVASEPHVFSGRESRFELSVRELSSDGRTIHPEFAIQVLWPGTPPSYGDEIEGCGTLERLPPARNPGQFDFAAWSARQGIRLQLRVENERDGRMIAKSRGNPLIAAALRARDWMKATLEQGVGDPLVSGLIVAMVVGDTSAMPEEIQTEFRNTGTYHLFSVSGLHVGMLTIILWYIFRTLRMPRRYAAAAIIPLVFFYVVMTGWKPASIRAAVMASIILLGFLASRHPIIANNLFAAAFLILLANTNELFNPGFQLSFTVVAAILLFAGPLTARFQKPFQPDPFLPEKLLNPYQLLLMQSGRKTASLAGVSAAAWIGSFPLTVGYFHLVSFTALPANMLAVPVSFAIMAVSMLSLGAGIASSWTAAVYNQTNWLLGKLLLGIVSVFASIPGSFHFVGTPSFPPHEAEVVVFDFGAGGSAWLGAGGQQWLIDSGPARFQNNVLMPFLRSKGARSIDGLVITHGDAGHIGSAEALIALCRPERFISSTCDDRSALRIRLFSELERRGISKSLHRPGDRIPIGRNASLRILYPPPGLARSASDDKALVARLDAGNVRVLFLSDGGLFTEEWLKRNCPDDIRADILVKGSTIGSARGDSSFLDAVRPRVVIATAADFPEGECIPPAYAEALAEKDIRLFRQDECGAVTVRIFSKRCEVSAFLNRKHYEFLH